AGRRDDRAGGRVDGARAARAGRPPRERGRLAVPDGGDERARSADDPVSARGAAAGRAPDGAAARHARPERRAVQLPRRAVVGLHGRLGPGARPPRLRARDRGLLRAALPSRGHRRLRTPPPRPAGGVPCRRTTRRRRMQRIFVTGASSGIGAGLARHYARPGATLGLVARRAARLEAVARDVRAAGAEAHVYAADVAAPGAMQAAIAAARAGAGGADLVGANAGVGIRNALREGEAAEVARLLQINVIGVTNTVIPFVPAMLRQGSGVLCAISSVAGHRALPGRVAYSASKKAVTTFMVGLRMDLHGSGVHAM